MTSRTNSSNEDLRVSSPSPRTLPSPPSPTSTFTPLSLEAADTFCKVRDLTVQTDSEGAMAGSIAGGFFFTNRSTMPCKLEGPLSVELRTQANKPLSVTSHSPRPWNPIALRPDETAVAGFVWSDYCGPVVHPGRIRARITLPGGRGTAEISTETGVPTCNGDAAMEPSETGSPGSLRLDGFNYSEYSKSSRNASSSDRVSNSGR